MLSKFEFKSVMVDELNVSLASTVNRSQLETPTRCGCGWNHLHVLVLMARAKAFKVFTIDRRVVFASG